MENEDKARNLAIELHSATHLGGQALWKLFHDRYEFKAGRRICLEVAQSCPQCQLGSDYGHRQKTTGAIQSQGPWDTLSIDIVGPLPADHRQEFRPQPRKPISSQNPLLVHGDLPGSILSQARRVL